MTRVTIPKLPSGVPGLDHVLGGGVPELSFNVIAGGPGCGKTTLGHQVMFANATPERKAIYFTIIGEPPIKMLRYQQQFSFFDFSKIDECIRFVNLADEARYGGLTAVLARIEKEVDETNPAIVVVDSFRSMLRRTNIEPDGELQLQDFVQRLAIHLTNCEATTFLLGEYDETERETAVFTVADGVLWLYQSVERNSVVRKLQVVKMRGQGQISGLHTARISDSGLSIFPRLENSTSEKSIDPRASKRISTGVASLDTMMNGGIPEGYSVLVAGPSGSGKTVLAHQFLLEGARRGEPGILAVFEKRPEDYLHTTPQGRELAKLVQKGLLEILYLRPLDLSVDETLLASRDAVKRIGAKRAVIDSLSGLELALAPMFREDFRESIYRMMGALTGSGVTVMSTAELEDSYASLQLSPRGVAFLADALILQRYVELDGQLRRAISVVKVRSSAHSNDLREYEIDDEGLRISSSAMRGHEGLLSATPHASIAKSTKPVAKKMSAGAKKKKRR